MEIFKDLILNKNLILMIFKQRSSRSWVTAREETYSGYCSCKCGSNCRNHSSVVYMSKMCAIILQLVSTPLDPIPIAEHFRMTESATMQTQLLKGRAY